MNCIEIKPTKTAKEKIKSLFPLPVRAVCSGPSGSGKTELIKAIILNHWTNYEFLYIFTKSLDQPCYKELQEIFNGLDDIEAHFSDTVIISIDECNRNSLIIIDDWSLKDLSEVYEMFRRSRPKNISVFYLTQCYTTANLQNIRNNLTILFLFKSTHYTKKIWEDFLSNVISLNDFKSLCASCWKNEYGFITIDLKNNRFYNKLENLISLEN